MEKISAIHRQTARLWFQGGPAGECGSRCRPSTSNCCVPQRKGSVWDGSLLSESCLKEASFPDVQKLSVRQTKVRGGDLCNPDSSTHYLFLLSYAHCLANSFSPQALTHFLPRISIQSVIQSFIHSLISSLVDYSRSLITYLKKKILYGFTSFDINSNHVTRIS